MSFELRLDVVGVSEEQGRRLSRRCAREGAWPVEFVPRRRRFPWSRPKGARLWMPDHRDGESLLADDAEWDASAWALNERQLPAFAAAIEIMGAELTQGFALRATWSGSEIRHERVLDAADLAELARRSLLNEFTRYVVTPAIPAAPPEANAERR